MPNLARNTQKVKSMYDHTPLPWYDVSGDICNTPDDSDIRIAMADREEPKTRPTERDANIRYIVKACNAYPDLIQFVKLVRDFFTDDSEGHAIYLKDQAERCLERVSHAEGQ